MKVQRILNVAVVGLGVGEQHALAYVRTGSCALTWVYDIDAARMDRVIADIGQGAGAGSFDAVLADASVDLVSIASYDDAHFAQVVAALQAGKHLFVEKPLCCSIDELRVIKQAWEASGSIRTAARMRRFMVVLPTTPRAHSTIGCPRRAENHLGLDCWRGKYREGGPLCDSS